MRLRINPQNPQIRLIRQVVECLKQGGVIVYPTDTVYGIGCNIFSKNSVKKIYQVKEREEKKPFSFICADLSDITQYAKVSNYAFKILRQRLPGPYTFVLEATRQVPTLLTTRQKTVGIRIPDSPIALAIVQELGHPIVTTSANLAGDATPDNPDELEDFFGPRVDMLVDGGHLYGDPSTVISLVDDQIDILRPGAGDTSWITG